MSRIAYVNGRYLPARDASVNVEDRGYQFADGVYEVCEVRDGRLVDAPRHLARLQRSLGELRIAAADAACLARIRHARDRAAQPRQLRPGLSSDHPRGRAARPCLSAAADRAERGRDGQEPELREEPGDGKQRHRGHHHAGKPLAARRHQVGIAVAECARKTGSAGARRLRGMVRRCGRALSPRARPATPGS